MKNISEQQYLTHLLTFLEEILSLCTAHLSIVVCSLVQYSAAVKEEKESFCSCIKCEIPRELLLHTNQLMSPLEIGFEWFRENGLESAILLEEQKQ